MKPFFPSLFFFSLSLPFELSDAWAPSVSSCSFNPFTPSTKALTKLLIFDAGINKSSVFVSPLASILATCVFLGHY